MCKTIDYSLSKKSTRLLPIFLKGSTKSALEMVKGMKLLDIRELEVPVKSAFSAMSHLYECARKTGFSMKIGQTKEGAKFGNVILVFRKVKKNPSRNTRGK